MLPDRSSINLICCANDHEINKHYDKRKEKEKLLFFFYYFSSLNCRICRNADQIHLKYTKCVILFSVSKRNNIVLRRRHFSNSNIHLVYISVQFLSWIYVSAQRTVCVWEWRKCSSWKSTDAIIIHKYTCVQSVRRLCRKMLYSPVLPLLHISFLYFHSK